MDGICDNCSGIDTGVELRPPQIVCTSPVNERPNKCADCGVSIGKGYSLCIRCADIEEGNEVD